MEDQTERTLECLNPTAYALVPIQHVTPAVIRRREAAVDPVVGLSVLPNEPPYLLAMSIHKRHVTGWRERTLYGCATVRKYDTSRCICGRAVTGVVVTDTKMIESICCQEVDLDHVLSSR